VWDPLRNSALIELVICLRDLLWKADHYGVRVAFTDDVMANAYVKDVTDAVTAVRDACCHIDSFKKLFDKSGNRGAFITVSKTRGMAAVTLGGVSLRNDYEDDTAFFFGPNRLYLRRHIVRAFGEARRNLGM